MDCSTPGFLVLHYLLEFAQIYVPWCYSNHLILCFPFLLFPSIFSSIRVFSNESALLIRWVHTHMQACMLSHFSHFRLLVTLWTDPVKLFCPQDSPGKNTGVGCHALLQGIFLTQGLNPCFLQLLHCRWILHCWATREAHTNTYTSTESYIQSVYSEDSTSRSPLTTTALEHNPDNMLIGDHGSYLALSRLFIVI